MSKPLPRKKRRPPQRISWPTMLSQDNSKMSDRERMKNNTRKQVHPEQTRVDLDRGNVSQRKRARTENNHAQNSDAGGNWDANDAVMWIEKFSPDSSSDLCVAPKKVKEIKAWIHDSLSQKCQKLLILVGSPGIGKSTAVRIIAKESNISILSWNELIHSRTSYDSQSRGLFSVEQTTPLNSFNEFLQQSGSGISSLNVTSSSSSSDTNKSNSMILLEDLPNLHGPSAEMRFRNIMTHHLHRSHVPTILVFSDVTEGKHRPEDLERLINPDILYNNEQTTIMQIHPTTKPKMKKILTTIANRENYRVGANFFEELHHQSNGDIRHAIMTLQLHATGSQKAKSTTMELGNGGQNDRDTKISTFHSLGKLLYAKRVIENGVSRLKFDPETILQRSDLGIEGSLKFLEFHSADFFTDIIELSRAYSLFSDAADILGCGATRRGYREMSNDGTTVFPYDCASSIAGRTVANTNRNPAPNKFRQFSRPKVFDVLRNGSQNQILLDQLSRRLMSQSFQRSSKCNFVTESLPFVRQICPQEVDPYLDNLYSTAIQNHREKLGSQSSKDDDNLYFQKEQDDLLKLDDIDEFDSE